MSVVDGAGPVEPETGWAGAAWELVAGRLLVFPDDEPLVVVWEELLDVEVVWPELPLELVCPEPLDWLELVWPEPLGWLEPPPLGDGLDPLVLDGAEPLVGWLGLCDPPVPWG